MLALAGTYENGVLKLDKEYNSKTPTKVIVTFLEETETAPEQGKRLTLDDFSFRKSQKDLENYHGQSFLDTLIEERRGDI